MVDAQEGFIFHPDPDVLAAYELGYHEYPNVEDAKQAYVEGDLSHLEFRAVLEDLLS